MTEYRNKEQIHPYKSFVADLGRDEVVPVILLMGEEEYLTKLAVQELVKKYVTKGSEAFDFLCYDKTSTLETPVMDLIDQCDMYSFTSQKKVVWLKDFEPLEKNGSKEVSQREIDRVLSYAENPSDGSVLVISSSKKDEKNAARKGEKSSFLKSISALSKTYVFTPLAYGDLVSFLQRRFSQNGVSVPRDVIKLIIDESGYYTKESTYRLYNLCADVEKMIAHAGGKGITERDVIETLHGHLDSYIFHFIDGLSKKNKEQAFEVLQNILSGEKNVYNVLTVLVNHFELLLTVWELRNAGLSQAKIAAETKVHAYRIEVAYNMCSRFSGEQIKNRLIQLYEIDRAIKTGELEGKLALELFLWKA